MKQFKKRRTKFPRLGSVERMIRQSKNTYKIAQYLREVTAGIGLIPLPIRQTTLARLCVNKRGNIAYYPDLHNFLMYDSPNRSIPIQKFLDIFRGMMSKEELDQLVHDLTAFRLVFHTDPNEWINVYDDDNVHSCMSQMTVVRCYAHPANKLALVALYAPGGNRVVARTIVNTEHKFYIRLFGDELLVNKLKEQGYKKIDRIIPEFKMYGRTQDGYLFGDKYELPFFDFRCTSHRALPLTHDPTRNLVEIVVNPGVSWI